MKGELKMLNVKLERYLNTFWRKDEAKSFASLSELENWIFDQMQQDYSRNTWAMSFPTPASARNIHADGPWAIKFQPIPGETTISIHQIESSEGIIFQMAVVQPEGNIGQTRFRHGSRIVSSVGGSHSSTLPPVRSHSHASCGRGLAFHFGLPLKRKPLSSGQTKPYRKKPFGKSSLMGALRRTGTAMYRRRQRSSSMRITGPITPSETSVSRCEGSVA